MTATCVPLSAVGLAVEGASVSCPFMVTAQNEPDGHDVLPDVECYLWGSASPPPLGYGSGFWVSSLVSLLVYIEIRPRLES